MVLESLIGPVMAERKPYHMFFIGILYSSIALLLSQWIFHDQAGIIMITLTVMASIPLIYNTVKMEERKDTEIKQEMILLKEHGKALMFFMYLFLGCTVSLTIWDVFLPSVTVQNLVYSQILTYRNINSQITGNVVITLSRFSSIFLNNLKVLMFCLLFSFLYGIGSIFILTWNASVLAVAVGNFVRTNISQYAESLHFFRVAGYFHIFSLGLLKYMIHGIPEILSYFVGGLAGGIISIAVIRHDLGSKNFENIILDSADLLIISLVLLLVAALLEVFVTPILF